MGYLALLFWILAAVFKAVMDTLAHHFSSSVFVKYDWDFWDPQISWANKYKDNKKWYGWINDTILVWITDAWHLAQMLMKTCIVLTIVFYRPLLGGWDLLILTVIWGLVFEIFYKYLLRKK